MTIWVDIINPSHALFFNSIRSGLPQKEFYVTVRDRAETVDLVRLLGINGKIIGADNRDSIKKTMAMITRTVRLLMEIKDFDCSLSFENGMSVGVSKIKGKRSILFCDNDLKLMQQGSVTQTIESRIKFLADHTLIPVACRDSFSTWIEGDRLRTYDGYKEDVYIADYHPDPHFMDHIPFDHFVVLRPEALASFYVLEHMTIIPELIRLFDHEGIKVIYLPRDEGDADYVKGSNALILDEPLNGLDLCYYSDAVLTGSGTMAREAACMGKCAVSFFPNKTLLSVDNELINAGKMMHSRDPEEILNYVLSKGRMTRNTDFDRSRRVKEDVISILSELC
jgi:predicted glycosyltransferase